MDENLLSPLRNASHRPAPDWDAMERRLLAAFHQQASPRAHRAMTWRAAVRRSRGMWRWLSAAAVLVLAAAITYYPSPLPGPHSNPAAPAPRPTPQAAPSPDRAAAVAPPRLPHEMPQPVPVVLDRPAPRTRSARVHRPATRTPAASPAQPTAGPSPNDFVFFPSAAGLPTFESGRIVRISVPLTSLPAYGIDLVPDAATNDVEADFLIGQDGIPRAIRLASYRRD